MGDKKIIDRWYEELLNDLKAELDFGIGLLEEHYV